MNAAPFVEKYPLRDIFLPQAGVTASTSPKAAERQFFFVLKVDSNSGFS